MANQFATSRIVLQTLAIELYNNLQLGKLVHRYGSETFIPPKVGAVSSVVDVPMPIRYEAKAGPSLQIQSIVETTKAVAVDQDFHVGLDMSVWDATFNTKDDIKSASSKYLVPAAKTLAEKVDDYLAGLATQIHQSAGTAGTTLGSGTAAATQQAISLIRQIQTENGVSNKENRMLVLAPKESGYVPSALSALFVREAQEGVKTGRLGHLLGYDLYESGNIRKHTAGALAGAALTNGVDQEGGTINIDGLDPTDNVKVGDIITFAGVYAVNVQSKRQVTSDRLMEFYVTAAETAAGGAISVDIFPEIVTTGPYQNVSNAVADGQVVTLKASHVANMAITKDTLCLATMPLKKPVGAKVAEIIQHEGLSLLLTVDYDIQERRDITRVDIVFGGRELYGQTGVRVLG